MVCFVLGLFTFCDSASAQKFDFGAYLKKKDVNSNGRIDPEEMSDNTRGFLSKMGFDNTKSISIAKILSKANKDRKEATAKKSQLSRTRKVPGFGVEETTESTGVARFGSSESSSSSSTKEAKYSENTKRQVKGTLERYDRNKDGSLDRSEIKNARWGSPSPEQSDTNKDGRLSKSELAARYAAREKYYASSRDRGSSDRGSSDRSQRSSSYYGRSSSDRESELAKRKEAEERARREKEKSRYRSSSSSSSSSSSRPSYSRSSSSRSSGSSSKNSGDSQAKFEKYAESLIKQYDKDNNGKLSKDETKEMRRAPVGADTDKDGFITKSELIASLDPASKSKGKVAAKPTKSSDRDRGSDRSSSRFGRDRGSSSGSSRVGSSSSFEKLDSNTDNRVQMHEYATKWDDDKVEEFYEKDRNGDGVITLREWTGR